jgi:hypothetical protein
MPGTPIRLTLRSQADKNPYKDRKTPGPSRLRKHLASWGRDPCGRAVCHHPVSPCSAGPDRA